MKVFVCSFLFFNLCPVIIQDMFFLKLIVKNCKQLKKECYKQLKLWNNISVIDNIGVKIMITDYKYSFDGMSTNCEPQDNEFTELDYEVTLVNKPCFVYMNDDRKIMLYLYIEYMNMSEYDDSQEHIITIGVIPSFNDLSVKKQQDILSQFDESVLEWVKHDDNALIQAIYNYGYYIPLHTVTVTNENEVEHVIKSAKAVHTAVSGLIGFELDKMRNRLGNTGWDLLDEYCDDIDLLQVVKDRYKKQGV